MINILTNKLPESIDKKNIVWKCNDPVLYDKYCQYNKKESNLIPKVLNVIPVIADRVNVNSLNTTITIDKVSDIIPVDIVKPNIPVDKRDYSILEDRNRVVPVELDINDIPVDNIRFVMVDRVNAIIPVDIVKPNIPVDKRDYSILEDRNQVVPVELDINDIPVDKISTIVVDRVNSNNPNKVNNPNNPNNPNKVNKVNNKVKKNINSPMKIILEESQTYETFRDDVREKIINFVSSKEFNKVFGITKSAEIMSGIANNRFNKSTVLFISFLFDKCVVYNNKNIIYNKNNGIIMI
jgi:hypothetical protein